MKDLSVTKDAAVRIRKAVIRRQDGTIVRGHLGSEISADLNSLAGSSLPLVHEIMETFVSEGGTRLDLDWSQVKAVFFVSSFEGDCGYEAVRFFSCGPEVQCIWVEIVFADGEVIEGCIRNSLHHLKDDGFFLHPSTPGSNNLLIYVNKAAIVAYRVLGVRTLENQ